MHFILEHQAQFAANLRQTNGRVLRLETNMAEMARVQTHTSEVLTVMARAQTHMNEVVAGMADTYRHTEEKLDAFIGGLERHITGGRNGGSNGENAR